MPGRPITLPGHNLLNALLFLVIVALAGWQVSTESALLVPFLLLCALSLVLGVMLVMPIGGADMPVVISLLNSYSGIAAGMTGFVINNQVLIIAGALVGSSGIILSQVMCKAMNRSLTNVLFGAFGATAGSERRRQERRGPDGEVDHPGGSRGAGRLRAEDDHRARLRHGGRAGAASGARAGGSGREARRHGEIRDPSGGRTHAGPHERAARRGQRPVRPVVRDGRDQQRVRGHGRLSRHRRQRRRQSGRADRQRARRSTACRSSTRTRRR